MFIKSFFDEKYTMGIVSLDEDLEAELCEGTVLIDLELLEKFIKKIKEETSRTNDDRKEAIIRIARSERINAGLLLISTPETNDKHESYALGGLKENRFCENYWW